MVFSRASPAVYAAFLACLASSLLQCEAARQRSVATRAGANPIRKVVNMLQSIQKKVEEEGEQEEKLHTSAKCDCESHQADLKKGIADAQAKLPQLESSIKADEDKKAQMQSDIDTAKVERKSATQAMKEATAIRETNAKRYREKKASDEEALNSLKRATQAFQNGKADSFIHTASGEVLRRVLLGQGSRSNNQEVMAFLERGKVDAPGLAMMMGILGEMQQDYTEDLAQAAKQEEQEVEQFKALLHAKQMQVDALTEQVETKLSHVGKLSVQVAELKADLSDTEETLKDDQRLLTVVGQSCNDQIKDMEERRQLRQQELQALAETVKVLNDDDALDLFKKTLPSPSASVLLQTEGTLGATRDRALAALRSAKGRRAVQVYRPQLDFIMLALHGKKVGFGKVIGMIDEMVNTLKKEQVDDDQKRDFCTTKLDSEEDAKKTVERQLSDVEAALAETKENIQMLGEEVVSLETGIESLDKSVADATKQRKEAHAEYLQNQQLDTEAKKLIAFAKNRLNKFYNPKMYTEPSEGGNNPTLVQVSALPSYDKKSQESNGVIQMMNLLVRDLDQDLVKAETEEKNAQADYEEMMTDSKAKRSTDSKALAEKIAATANMKEELESEKTTKRSSKKELEATKSSIAALHADCDFLMKQFGARKEARADEIDALSNAKAVLSGADYAMLQLRSTRHQGVGSV